MAIEKRKERERVCLGKKTDKVFENKYQLYESASEDEIKAIEEYEHFTFLYICIIEQLQSFDSDGEIRDRKIAEEEIKIALDLMEELGNESINKDVQTVRGLLLELLHYFEQTKKSVEKCQVLGVPDSTLKVLYLAWQCGRI